MLNWKRINNYHLRANDTEFHNVYTITRLIVKKGEYCFTAWVNKKIIESRFKHQDLSIKI